MVTTLETAIQTLYARTRELILPYKDPTALRSRIGDVLHRAGHRPDWWHDSRPSPFRVAPDVDPRQVRVQWLDVVDDTMVPLMTLMFPDVRIITPVMPPVTAGNGFVVQYLSPQFYPARAMAYRKQHRMMDREAPNLGNLLPFIRERQRHLLSRWLDLSIEDASAWFTKDSFSLLDASGKTVTQTHRAHETGFTFRATGFVGQAIYLGRDEETTKEAAQWLRIAALWGGASGTTWGWSSLWATQVEMAATREPEVAIR